MIETPQKADRDYQAEMAEDIKIIKGWIIFFGFLAIIGITAGIVFGVLIVHAIGQIGS